MRYTRSYYHDGATQHGRYPADEGLGIQAGFTVGVKRLAVKVATMLSYAAAETLLDELADIQMAGSRIWQEVQTVGVAATDWIEAQTAVANALLNPSEISAGLAVTPIRLAATLDGATVQIRGEGWKEVKVGCVFEVVPNPKAQAHDRETVNAQHIEYVFHLGSPEPFGQHLWATAQHRGWLAASTTAVVGDGAPWIWNLADRHFPTSTHIVDWYHAKQHLWAAAHLIAPDSEATAGAWVDRMEDRLFKGDARAIAGLLRTAADPPTAASALLVREAGYFEDNAPRMQYHPFRQASLPIGSGTVESAAKQFKDRFTQAGMRWSRSGAVNLLPFRAALLSRSFDALWHAVCP